MRKPLALLVSGLLLALPLACGDDDDSGGGTGGGKGGSTAKGGSGGTAAGATTGGTAGSKGGSGGGSAGTGARGGTGGTVTGGAGGNDAGAGGNDAGAGGVAGGAGGIGGAGGSLGGQNGEAGQGGSGGAGEVGAQFTAAATSICVSADPLNCSKELTCLDHWQEGYMNAACASTYRVYIDCVDALEPANLACDADGNSGPDFESNPGQGCIDELAAHSACVVANL